MFPTLGNSSAEADQSVSCLHTVPRHGQASGTVQPTANRTPGVGFSYMGIPQDTVPTYNIPLPGGMNNLRSPFHGRVIENKESASLHVGEEEDYTPKVPRINFPDLRRFFHPYPKAEKCIILMEKSVTEGYLLKANEMKFWQDSFQVVKEMKNFLIRTTKQFEKFEVYQKQLHRYQTTEARTQQKLDVVIRPQHVPKPNYIGNTQMGTNQSAGSSSAQSLAAGMKKESESADSQQSFGNELQMPVLEICDQPPMPTTSQQPRALEQNMNKTSMEGSSNNFGLPPPGFQELPRGASAPDFTGLTLNNFLLFQQFTGSNNFLVFQHLMQAARPATEGQNHAQQMAFNAEGLRNSQNQ